MVKMIRWGSRSFSATGVAGSGLVTAGALGRALELENKVLRLRHHVSVLSKWCDKQELRIGELLVGGDRREEEEEVAVVEESVADVEKEAGVPDPMMVSRIMAVGDEDVVVSGVTGGVVAVSVEEVRSEEVEVALVRLQVGAKERRLNGDSGMEAVGDLAVVRALLGPRG